MKHIRSDVHRTPITTALERKSESKLSRDERGRARAQDVALGMLPIHCAGALHMRIFVVAMRVFCNRRNPHQSRIFCCRHFRLRSRCKVHARSFFVDASVREVPQRHFFTSKKKFHREGSKVRAKTRSRSKTANRCKVIRVGDRLTTRDERALKMPVRDVLRRDMAPRAQVTVSKSERRDVAQRDEGARCGRSRPASASSGACPWSGTSSTSISSRRARIASTVAAERMSELRAAHHHQRNARERVELRPRAAAADVRRRPLPSVFEIFGS